MCNSSSSRAFEAVRVKGKVKLVVKGVGLKGKKVDGVFDVWVSKVLWVRGVNKLVRKFIASTTNAKAVAFEYLGCLFNFLKDVCEDVVVVVFVKEFKVK